MWEHQDIEAADAPPDADAVAEWKRAYARYTFAFIGDSRINDSGNLELRHDNVAERDAEQLKRVRSVSPKIYDGYCDSRGGEYEGTTVAHVAATPTPVQYWQKPWELSDSDALYLSYAPPEKPVPCPPYSDSFEALLDDLDAGLELSTTDAPDEGEPVADEKDDKPKGDGEGGDFAALVKALKAKGISISDRVKDMAGLIIAIESNGGASEAPVEDDLDNGNPDDDVTTTPAGGAPPMMMSTFDTDPKKRKQAEQYAADERKEASDRIAAALESGRLTPPEARKLRRQAEGFELSFTDGEQTGEKWKALLKAVADAEAKPAHSAWRPTGATSLSTTQVPAPPFAGDPAGDEDNPVLKLQRELAKQFSVTTAPK